MCEITNALNEALGGDWKKVALSPGDMAIFMCGDMYWLAPNVKQAAITECGKGEGDHAPEMAAGILHAGCNTHQREDAAALLVEFAKYIQVINS